MSDPRRSSKKPEHGSTKAPQTFSAKLLEQIPNSDVFSAPLQSIKLSVCESLVKNTTPKSYLIELFLNRFKDREGLHGMLKESFGSAFDRVVETCDFGTCSVQKSFEDEEFWTGVEARQGAELSDEIAHNFGRFCSLDRALKQKLERLRSHNLELKAQRFVSVELKRVKNMVDNIRSSNSQSAELKNQKLEEEEKEKIKELEEELQLRRKTIEENMTARKKRIEELEQTHTEQKQRLIEVLQTKPRFETMAEEYEQKVQDDIKEAIETRRQLHSAYPPRPLSTGPDTPELEEGETSKNFSIDAELAKKTHRRQKSPVPPEPEAPPVDRKVLREKMKDYASQVRANFLPPPLGPEELEYLQQKILEPEHKKQEAKELLLQKQIDNIEKGKQYLRESVERLPKGKPKLPSVSQPKKERKPQVRSFILKKTSTTKGPKIPKEDAHAYNLISDIDRKIQTNKENQKSLRNQAAELEEVSRSKLALLKSNKINHLQETNSEKLMFSLLHAKLNLINQLE